MKGNVGIHSGEHDSSTGGWGSLWSRLASLPEERAIAKIPQPHGVSACPLSPLPPYRPISSPQPLCTLEQRNQQVSGGSILLSTANCSWALHPSVSDVPNLDGLERKVGDLMWVCGDV